MQLEPQIHIECYRQGCGHLICMSQATNARLRRTHETFYCPAGHGQAYHGQTEQEKELEDLRRRASRHQEQTRDWVRYVHKLQDEGTRLRRVTRTCPLCDEVMPRTRARLYRHLTEVHAANADVQVEVES
jgi:hypothetical protein